ncbi:10646_t:CDS:2, partial [Gigaspora rosea]
VVGVVQFGASFVVGVSFAAGWYFAFLRWCRTFFTLLALFIPVSFFILFAVGVVLFVVGVVLFIVGVRISLLGNNFDVFVVGVFSQAVRLEEHLDLAHKVVIMGNWRKKDTGFGLSTRIRNNLPWRSK